jgi:starch synthase
VRVLFATAEFAPLARVGGLAAAAAGLVHELRRQGVDVQVVLPDYFGTTLEQETSITLDVPEWWRPATARTGHLDGVGEITLVDVPGIRRNHPYLRPDGKGWPDNDNRFFGFSAGVASLVTTTRPELLHLNDWHTATTVAHLRRPPPTVLTIHTLGYQGQTNIGWLRVFPYRAELFELDGDCNPLVGGIRTADLVLTVSPNYAAEIRTDEHGLDAAAVLRRKDDRLVGILNGIDTRAWDPAHDPHLRAHYSVGDVAPKSELRRGLLDEFDLHDGGGPLMAMVTRLTQQKGVDLVIPLAPFLRSVAGRLVLLGSGDADLVGALTQTRLAHPDEVAFVNGYDEPLAHRIFGGADVLIMPSRFEPCGLAQMQAMRYGTLPLVTDVGGLHDTVIDVEASPTRGTGIVAPGPTSVALMDGMHRMARAIAQPRRRAAMQRRGMLIDWSWEAPAREHVEWYDRLVASGA